MCRQYLAGLAAIVVDGLLPQDDQLRLLIVGQRLEQRGNCRGLQRFGRLDQDAAVGADGLRGTQVSRRCATPQETAMISATLPHSLGRIASSTAISSKGSRPS